MILGSMPSIRRWAIDFIELSRMPKIAAAMSRPTIASARGKPSHTPTTPTTTAMEVRPSARACCPSAIKAAEPILRPVRIR